MDKLLHHQQSRGSSKKVCCCIGDNALKFYNGFTFPKEENITVADIIAKFDTFAVGETNETYERFLFNKRNQLEGESFAIFLAAISSLVKNMELL